MAKRPDAQAFLAAMQGPPEIDEALAPASRSSPQPAADVRTLPKVPRSSHSTAKAKPAKPSRAELKHFGGYLDDDTLEKIALLRVRLKKDNSELIKHAIDELYSKHSAKRAFGDA